MDIVKEEGRRAYVNKEKEEMKKICLVEEDALHRPQHKKGVQTIKLTNELNSAIFVDGNNTGI